LSLLLSNPTSLHCAGELRHINKLRYWPLEAVLHDKYLFPKPIADEISSFLTPMLRLHPDKRAKASELIHHKWLDGTVVQGEIDVIRRAEAEEMRKKERESGIANGIASTAESTIPADRTDGSGLSDNQRRVSAVAQSEVDAMKPVDDFAALGGYTEQTSSSPQAPSSRGQEVGHALPKLTAAPTSSFAAKENAVSNRQVGPGEGRMPDSISPPTSFDGARFSARANSANRRS
jgi:serine/threonine-protein kinase SRPK3